MNMTKQVAILCPDGTHYVRVSRDGTLDAVADRVGPWEKFVREECTDGTFSLRTLDVHPESAKFVRAVAGGGGIVVADRSEAKPHEKFTEVPIAGGKTAIETASGNFWRAKMAGGESLDSVATAIGPWEEFTIEELQ